MRTYRSSRKRAVVIPIDDVTLPGSQLAWARGSARVGGLLWRQLVEIATRAGMRTGKMTVLRDP